MKSLLLIATCALFASTLGLGANPVGTLDSAHGSILKNGQPIAAGTVLNAGDLIETGNDSRAILKIDPDLRMLLKSNSSVRLTLGALEASLEKGGVQAYLRPSALKTPSSQPRFLLKTKAATMGVRGTSFYAEERGNTLFFCDCEGKVSVSSGKETSTFETRHHDRPTLIDLGGASLQNRMRLAADQDANHSDEEIAELKAVR